MKNIELNKTGWADPKNRNYINSSLQSKGTIRFQFRPNTFLNVVEHLEDLETLEPLQEKDIYVPFPKEGKNQITAKRSSVELNVFLSEGVKINSPLEVDFFTFIYICDKIDIPSSLVSFKKLLKEYGIEGKIEGDFIDIGGDNKFINKPIHCFHYSTTSNLLKTLVFCDTSKIFKEEKECIQFNESLLKILEKGEI